MARRSIYVLGFAACASLLFFNSVLFGQTAVPGLVTFSGALRDAKGHPLQGVVGVTFSLYKEQQGGAPLWTENQNAQLDDQGRYLVLLGATHASGLPIDLFASGEPRWLGVQAQLPEEQEQPRVVGHCDRIARGIDRHQAGAALVELKARCRS